MRLLFPTLATLLVTVAVTTSEAAPVDTGGHTAVEEPVIPIDGAVYGAAAGNDVNHDVSKTGDEIEEFMNVVEALLAIDEAKDAAGNSRFLDSDFPLPTRKRRAADTSDGNLDIEGDVIRMPVPGLNKRGDVIRMPVHGLNKRGVSRTRRSGGSYNRNTGEYTWGDRDQYHLRPHASGDSRNYEVGVEFQWDIGK